MEVGRAIWSDLPRTRADSRLPPLAGLRNRRIIRRATQAFLVRGFRVEKDMLRVVATRVASAARSAMVPRVVGTQCTRASHDGPKETDEEFDQRYVNFFNRNDIDHWEIRKAMNDLAGELAFLAPRRRPPPRLVSVRRSTDTPNQPWCPFARAEKSRSIPRSHCVSLRARTPEPSSIPSIVASVKVRLKLCSRSTTFPLVFFLRLLC